MKIALISQGPTASLWTGERADYQAVIGVNGVPCVWECDHWAYADAGAFEKWGPDVKSRPAITTKAGNRDETRRKRSDLAALIGEFRWQAVNDLRLPRFPSGGMLWTRHGGLIGLGLAWSMKPERIDCYGVDLGGLLDFLGKPPHHHASRNQTRWDRERLVWGEMVKAMGGIEVRHVQPDGSFKRWEVVQPEPVQGRRRYQYESGNGFTTMTFEAQSEDAFRNLLRRMIGPKRAGVVKIREVA